MITRYIKMDNNYAPTNQSLSYDNYTDPSYVKDLDGIPNDPYGVDEYYYAELVMKEWNVECPTDVAKLYFSVSNIKRIQRGIRREIYNRSFGKFRLREDQNVLDLITAMRAVYKWNAKDLPMKVVRQVKMLNEQTVQYIAPDMMDNLKQHYGYLDDIKNPINPMPEPINVNHAGRLQLPSVAQLYGI
jgi:hypothetical protein